MSKTRGFLNHKTFFTMKMFRYDVLCIGSATVDHFLTIHGSHRDVKIGDKVLVKSIEVHSGGGATNSAAALAKFGLKVKMFTKLGDDHNSDYIIKSMKRYNVKNICLNRSKHATDSATIISSEEEKDRIIYVHKGASRDLSLNDCKKLQLNTKWVYLASLVGKSFQTAKKVTEYAKKNKIKVLFNPSLYLAKKGKRSLRSVLQATEVIVLNKEEAQALLNSSSNDFITLLKDLHACGPNYVVITNGKKGFYAYHDKHLYSLNKTPKVNRVHTAGAGDAFTSGLLAGIIKKYSFEDALKIGQVNSSSIIQHVGTKNKLLTENEAKQSMKKFKIKIKVRKC